MTIMVPAVEAGELWRQARIARQLGSFFVAEVLEAAERQLHRAPRTAEMVRTWPGDPSAAAMAMRLNAALHALARRDTIPVLTALYRGEHEDYDRAIAAALTLADEFIQKWMMNVPQTNEVGRAAAIAAALMQVSGRTGMPFELLELGSSCGLNLNLARYGYNLGGATAGVADSRVQIAPVWHGPAPDVAPLQVVRAEGVDLNPLDPGDEATRERLLAFIWADQRKRSYRLQQALALACCHPPVVHQGHAVPWLADRLARPQAEGVCRAVIHSMVLQYLTAEERAQVTAMIAEAGARATASRPLCWISFEWTPPRTEVLLTLTSWPDGEKRVLAKCHPYGDWVEWTEEQGRA